MEQIGFKITRVDISRGYGDSDPFTAKIYVNNHYNANMEIKVSEERTLALIDAVSDLIHDALNQSLVSMRQTALEKVEATRIEHQPIDAEYSEVNDDDIPF